MNTVRERAAALNIDPGGVVYGREAGTAPPMPPCGRSRSYSRRKTAGAASRSPFGVQGGGTPTRPAGS